MAWIDRLERFSIFFQGGVRRSLLYFIGICLLLAWPVQYLGQAAAMLVGRIRLEPGPAVVLPNFANLDYEIGQTRIARLGNGEQDVYLEVDNRPNQDFGLSPWVYELQLRDPQGQVINRQTYSSYLLPGETKYVVTRDPSGRASEMTLTELDTTRVVDYNPQANPFQKLPEVRVSNSQITPQNQNQIQLSALLTNRDRLEIQTVDVTYVLRDQNREIVGIGEGRFNGFIPEETREFVATHPTPETGAVRFLEVIWSTDYLRDGNIRFNR